MASIPSWLQGPQSAIEARLSPIARRCHRRGLEAIHLSLAQAPFVVAAAALIATGRLRLGAAALLASLGLDLLDGFFARATETTSSQGHLADKAMDVAGIAATIAAIAWARPGLWPQLALAGAATAFLYGFGWVWDPELVTGIRAAALAWLVVPSAAWLLWLPGIAGLAQTPLAVWKRRPKDDNG